MRPLELLFLSFNTHVRWVTVICTHSTCNEYAFSPT